MKTTNGKCNLLTAAPLFISMIACILAFGCSKKEASSSATPVTPSNEVSAATSIAKVESDKLKTLQEMKMNEEKKAAEVPLLTYNEECSASEAGQLAVFTPTKLDEIAQAIYGKNYLEVIEVARTDPESSIFKRVGDLSQDLEENFGQYKTQYKVAKIIEGGLAEKCNGLIGDEITGLVILNKDELDEGLRGKSQIARILPALNSIKIEKVLEGVSDKNQAFRCFLREIYEYCQFNPDVCDKAFSDMSQISTISENLFYNSVLRNDESKAELEKLKRKFAVLNGDAMPLPQSIKVANAGKIQEVKDMIARLENGKPNQPWPDQTQLCKAYAEFKDEIFKSIGHEFQEVFLNSTFEVSLGDIKLDNGMKSYTMGNLKLKDNPRESYICGYTIPLGKRLAGIHYAPSEKFTYFPVFKQPNRNLYDVFNKFTGPDMLEVNLGVKVDIVTSVKTGLKRSELAPEETMFTTIPTTALQQRIINSINNLRGGKYATDNKCDWLTKLINNLKNDGFTKGLKIIRKDQNGSVVWGVTSDGKLIFSLIAPIYSKYAEEITPIDFLLNKNTENLVPTYIKGFESKNQPSFNEDPLRTTNRLIPCLYDKGIAWRNFGSIFKSDGSVIDITGRDPLVIKKSLLRKHLQYAQDDFVPKIVVVADQLPEFMDSKSLLSPTGDYTDDDVNFNRQDVGGYAVITKVDDGYFITYAFPASFLDKKVNTTQAFLKERKKGMAEAAEQMYEQQRKDNRAEKIQKLRQEGYIP